MTTSHPVQLFESTRVRSHWDAAQAKWYFSVVDVVQVLTYSSNPTDYLKKLRKRDAELGSYLGTICPQVAMLNESGLMHKNLGRVAKRAKDDLEKRTGQKVVTGSNFLPPGPSAPTQIPATPKRQTNNSPKK